MVSSYFTHSFVLNSVGVRCVFKQQVGLLLMSSESSIDSAVSIFDLATVLGSSQYNLARSEDQQHYLGLLQSEDQARESLGMVVAAILLASVFTVGGMEKLFKFDAKASVDRGYNILDLKLSTPNILIRFYFLNIFGIPFSSLETLFL